jgi:FkbM family methyltransferase
MGEIFIENAPEDKHEEPSRVSPDADARIGWMRLAFIFHSLPAVFGFRRTESTPPTALPFPVRIGYGVSHQQIPKDYFMVFLKQLAARLPKRWQAELKRIRYAKQIRRNTFATNEPEYLLLPQLVSPGDWVVDVGANVGHYTKRFSELVGPRGRVIAFEPMPATFSLLAANAQGFAHPNVTLINAAVSDKFDEAGMAVPDFASGLTNYYEAHLSPAADSALSVVTLSLDVLGIGHRIALVKIDAEDHESFVLAGMRKLIERDHPVLIVETGSRDLVERVAAWGYVPEKLAESPNFLFRAKR